MSGAHKWRIDLLCEDRRTESFVSRLCKRHGIRLMSVHRPDAGKGSAENWVVRQVPLLVKALRSVNYQGARGLWVVVDADKLGASGRTQELEAQLKDKAVELPPVADRVALLIPAWSIETWLASLNGVAGLMEDVPYKDPTVGLHGSELARQLRVLWDSESKTLDAAVAAWKSGPATLPALRKAYAETSKFGA
jgi:hypothetical protein